MRKSIAHAVLVARDRFVVRDRARYSRRGNCASDFALFTFAPFTLDTPRLPVPSSANPTNSEALAMNSAFKHVALFTKDPDRLLDFYGKLLGFSMIRRSPSGSLYTSDGL